jgi:hypothetical protein
MRQRCANKKSPSLPSVQPNFLLLWLLLVAFGDFVANVTAADGASNSGQLTAVTAAHLISNQASYYGSDADAKRTILSYGCRC